MPLKVTNSLTRAKEPFVPLEPGKVRMYVCGLTVYDHAHIGHARTYVAFDAIRRWLEFSGYDVRYVQNVTDVDDKIINAAKAAGVPAQEHADRFWREASGDLRRLGIRDADLYPKVSTSMPWIVEMIGAIVARKYAYVVASPDGDGQDVYFDVKSMKGYGKLSNRTVEEMVAGVRVDVRENKRDPADFALWKAAKPGEPWWESAWGKGRPGWHIECSAMTTRTLGETLDIHGGGRDLIFPHHENEVAQSEAASGKPFVRYWLHSGFLNVEGEKMSKSLGNFITVRDLLATWDPEVVRLFYLLTHYRSPIDFSQAGLEDAARGLERLRRAREALEKAASGLAYTPVPAFFDELGGPHEAFRESLRAFVAGFDAAMDDDFSTPVALSHLFDLVTAVNKYVAGADVNRTLAAHARNAFLDRCRVLTLFQDAGVAADEGPFGKAVDLLLDLRERARKAKDFRTADAIRDGLAALGVEVQDSEKGAVWRRRSETAPGAAESATAGSAPARLGAATSRPATAQAGTTTARAAGHGDADPGDPPAARAKARRKAS